MINDVDESSNPDETCMYHVVIAHPYIFYASIKCFRTHDMIHVGAKMRCVTVRYDHHENQFTLLATGYDEQCTLDGRMNRGSGTIKMIKAVFTFLCQQYPHAKKEILFDDQSTIECMGQKRLSLPQYYLSLHGETWYEAKFGAYPSNKTFRTKYIRDKERLRRYLRMHPKQSFEEVMKYASKPIRRLLKPVYEDPKCEDVYTFLHTINDEYDCAVFLEWLPTQVLKILPFIGSIPWAINMNLNQTKILVLPLSERPNDVVFGGSAMNNLGTCRDV
jgi:hypothetical protein